jgi:chaperonin cofactor prefoldin
VGYTNRTPNKYLPQFVESDKPSWLGDVNGAFSTIDNAFTTVESVQATTNNNVLTLQNQVATLNSQIQILKAAIIANGGHVSGI